MKRTLLCILYLTLVQNSNIFAQENFIFGQIISLDSIVTEGLIDYQNWRSNPKSIRFKETAASKVTEYRADEIKGFKTETEEYIGKIVKIDKNSFDHSELLYSKYAQLTNDTVFLQTLFTGDKSLYFLFKNNGRPYFFIDLDGELVLLEYHKYLKLKGKSYLAESKRYIGQLNYYFRDAREFQALIPQLEYTRQDISGLFAAYYNGRETDLVFKKDTERSRIEIKPLVGVSISNMDFSGPISQRISAIDNMSSVHPTLGIGIDLILSRSLGKWSINNDIFYTSHSASGKNINETIYSEISFGYIKIHSMARYKYFTKKGSFFANIGITNGILISETNYSNEESIFTSSEGFVFPETRNYELGYLLGLGMNYKRMSFEVRYERGNGVSPFISILSKAERCYFFVGYRI